MDRTLIFRLNSARVRHKCSEKFQMWVSLQIWSTVLIRNRAVFDEQMKYVNLPELSLVQLYLSMPVELKFSANVVRLACLNNGWFCSSTIFGRSSGYL